MATKLSKQVFTVKNIVDLLNQCFPIETDGIPTQLYVDRQLVDLSVLPHPHFTAIQSKSKSTTNDDYWWINCTSYNVWSSEEFKTSQEELKTLALEQGVEICFCFVFIVGLKRLIQDSKLNKSIIIGNYTNLFLQPN